MVLVKTTEKQINSRAQYSCQQWVRLFGI